MSDKMGFTRKKKELEASRFVEVRNLAYDGYKKPDGTGLMSYGETLDNRDSVINTVLQYELANGIIVPDYLDATFQHAKEVERLKEEIRDAKQRLTFLEEALLKCISKPKKQSNTKGVKNGN